MVSAWEVVIIKNNILQDHHPCKMTFFKVKCGIQIAKKEKACATAIACNPQVTVNRVSHGVSHEVSNNFDPGIKKNGIEYQYFSRYCIKVR